MRRLAVYILRYIVVVVYVCVLHFTLYIIMHVYVPELYSPIGGY